jgi:Zn-dependent M16 (insulinase) family peptidase
MKNLPEHLRLFAPMFAEFYPHVGTKNYKYDEFNNRMLGCTSGLSVSIDKYSRSEVITDLMDRHENLLLATGFLDQNVNKAFECLQEIIATPDFDDTSNIADLLKMESISLANNIGN